MDGASNEREVAAARVAMSDMLRGLRRCLSAILVLSLVGCGSTVAVESAARPVAPPRVSAYDSPPAGDGVFARVVCESTSGEEPSWVDIAIDGSGEDAMRVCDHELRTPLCAPGARRVVRACGRDALGPAPMVGHDATVLRHTSPAGGISLIVDAVEAHRKPPEAQGTVAVHLVYAKRETCEAIRDEAGARERVRGENARRSWLDGQRAALEQDLKQAREERAAFEKRVGRPVADLIASLRGQLDRARNEAERKRVRQALLDANLLELEDNRLRRQVEQGERLIEAIRSTPPYEPAVKFTCIAPRGR